MPVKTETSRAAGLDLTRVVAAFFVVSVHFFLNNGYYAAPLAGGSLFVMTAMRWLFFTCVPLFMLLSGFLLYDRKPNAAHYKKFLRVALEYLIICVICNLFRIFYLGQAIPLRDWVRSILQFSAAPYAWYINFYFGLFLLAPFLNLAYRGLTSRRQKKLLLGCLLLLTAIPSLVNGVVKIFPNWWEGFYPVTYYFLGCYLREFRPAPRRWLCLLGIAALSLFQAAWSFFTAGGGAFSMAVPYNYGALTTVCMTLLVFLLLYRTEPPAFLRRPLAAVSDCALSIYLISWVFDSMVYPALNAAVPAVHDRLPYYLLATPLIFLASTLCALPIRAARQYIFKGGRRDGV